MTILEHESLCAPDAPCDERAPRLRLAASLIGLDAAFRDIADVIDSALDQCAWADEEIEAAQLRHGENDRGPLWGSFSLLRPASDRPWPELLYRTHCRELLDRVAAGADTRPATDAEKLAVLSAASQTAPLNGGAETLYLRLGNRRFPNIFDRAAEVLDMQAYETVHGSRADEYEALLMRKLSQPWRTAGATVKTVEEPDIPLPV
ncbi:hypothetical protein Caci_8984 [Catenulispora acidiphila DSM 44928]|uniref:Uncharacterized protein n=1 Tax=Catenulispora acidiphila (strain DSM 44928 / JCM 14897 / NBRC 102108 / NRRL B-24433 / ID139908) TaxID=479433 RepID=C7Q5I6_CATAD|nr:hypothetical protein [Catenulispora acidiphila]ACU77797.1 hypothetical protein Caci_8984 [Catenulispora acidiphila DSM 44928]